MSLVYIYNTKINLNLDLLLSETTNIMIERPLVFIPGILGSTLAIGDVVFDLPTTSHSPQHPIF
jgi:hypothetical protein